MYSTDFKVACLRVYAKLLSFRKVAALVGSSPSSICRWLRVTANANSTRKTQASTFTNSIVLDAVHAHVLSHPFTTCHDVRAIIQTILGHPISYELARLAVKRSGFTRKRPRFYLNPQHLQQATVAFNATKDQLIGRRFVYVDETGFSSNVRPTCGYSKRGTRLHIRFMPTANDKKHTSVVAVADSQTGSVTTQSIQGHYTTALFVNFLSQLTFPQGTVFVMDNVRFHHSNAVKELFIQRGWIQLFSPPYSPWCNPIERVFSLVKAAYRRNRNIAAAFLSLNANTVQRILASRCVE